MNETKIKINGKNVPIVFGTWVVQELIESGYELEKLGEEVKRNPFKFVPNLIYLGACNGANMDLADYDKKDFYKFIDTVGFQSKEVTDIVNLFTKSFTTNLGADDKDDEKQKVEKQGAAKKK